MASDSDVKVLEERVANLITVVNQLRKELSEHIRSDASNFDNLRLLFAVMIALTVGDIGLKVVGML